MKITKTNIQAAERKGEILHANLGCRVCPCCGEDMNLLYAIKNGNFLKRGISSFPIQVLVKTGWFSKEYKTVIKYSCNRCGAEWESEPY